MAKVKRIREAISAPPTTEYWQEREATGWKPVAVEWERALTPEETQIGFVEEVPFGLRVADDCIHLQAEPVEEGALVAMLEMIIQDTPILKMADELNLRGYRTRDGKPWTPGMVFDMLPRLIEVGPRVFTTQEWAARRSRLLQAI